MVIWDTPRFLRYAGPRSDFHGAKDIRMMDLFDTNEDVPDEWRVYMFGNVIVIKKDELLTHRTLVPDRT